MKLRFLAIAFAATFLMVGAQAQVSHVSGSGSRQTSHAFTSDPIIYEQDPNFNGAFSSQNDTTGGFGNFATVYDNFTLNANYNVNSVEWVGSYFNPPQQGLITGFTINFYTGCNVGDINSCALQASYFTASNAGETFLGLDNVGDPTYIYGVTLGTSFAATAGQLYWLSIVPDLGFPPQWGLELSDMGDLNNPALQDFFGARSELPSHISFALDGTQVTGTPEPGTLVMLGTGILGLAGTLRRKLF